LLSCSTHLSVASLSLAMIIKTLGNLDSFCYISCCNLHLSTTAHIPLHVCKGRQLMPISSRCVCVNELWDFFSENYQRPTSWISIFPWMLHLATSWNIIKVVIFVLSATNYVGTRLKWKWDPEEKYLKNWRSSQWSFIPSQLSFAQNCKFSKQASYWQIPRISWHDWKYLHCF
jgi:hypothetical protein